MSEELQIPETLGVYSTFSWLCNNSHLFEEIDSDDLFADFMTGNLPVPIYKEYLLKVFDEYRSGNKKPLCGLIKKMKKNEINIPGEILLFVDTETSGLTGNDKVIQLAYIIKYYPWSESSIVLDTYCEYVNDNVKINKFAQQVHGISSTMLRLQGIDPRIVWRRYIRMSKLCSRILAFNAAFDKRMINNSIIGNGERGDDWECVMKMAKNKGQSGKLVDIHFRLVGTVMNNAHDALADVRGMISVYDKLISG